MPAMIDAQACIGCKQCDTSCPLDVIYFDEKEEKAEVRYPEECWMCGSCRQTCPIGAIMLRFPLNTLYNASANPYI